MDRTCKSSWTGAHEIFQAEEYDAGASPAHQASQRGRGGQLDKPTQILKMLWNCCTILNESFKRWHTCIL
jgi:hypothetical protein